MEKDDTIYEHDDKIAGRVTAAPTAVEIMEGDDDETEKRFSETTFGNFNEQWKEFKDAPGDICSSITITSKNKTRKIRNQKRRTRMTTRWTITLR